MRRMISRGKISVIVPTLNEELHLERLLRHLKTFPHIIETIVCDGGSVDKTREIALENGAVFTKTIANRGVQMNAGAAVSSGEILWFLHADTIPSKSSTRKMVQAARNPRICGGNFRLRFDTRSRGTHLVENIARVLRFFGVYYGDSGIWVRRETFDEIGGFENWPLFEDYDFVRRLEFFARRRGLKTVCIAAPLVVSSRRFGGGMARLLWRWLALQIAFWRGKSPHELARRYHK